MVTFDNFCAISLATALEHHGANQFLRAATNLNFVQPKLFQVLVKMITASPIARCPSFKFLTMQMQPSASWARNCRPFYPRPPCSQTSRAVSTDELARSDF